MPSYGQAESMAVNYFEIIRDESSDSQKRYFVRVVQYSPIILNVHTSI